MEEELLGWKGLRRKVDRTMGKGGLGRAVVKANDA